MNLRYRNISTPIALLVTLAIGQLFIGAGFAEANFVSLAPEATPAPILGILSTHDNKPITVNGASALGGATIPSGATIETPDGVGATIKLPGMGTICIAPNSKVLVEFDRTGKTGTIKITVLEGCVILTTLKNIAGLVVSGQGNLGQTPAATGGTVDVCAKAGSAPSVDQGAAATAGAGASALDCGAAGAAAAPPTGIPVGATVAILAGGAGGLYELFRGGNPSTSSPSAP